VESNVVRNTGYRGGVERLAWHAMLLLMLVDARQCENLNPTDQKVGGSNPFGRALASLALTSTNGQGQIVS
jgi:hypothetical protein